MGIRRRLIAVDGDGDEYYGIMEWNKWKHEICSSCGAMNFTKSERNKDRKTSQKYSRRNTIWKCIQPLCNNGMSSDVLQLIEFGRHTDINTRWSKIIDCMIEDKKKYKTEGGIHPNLR